MRIKGLIELLLLIFLVTMILVVLNVAFLNAILSEVFTTSCEEQLPICHEDNKSCQLENEMHEQVNIVRQEIDSSTLKNDAILAEIARAHSQDMINRNFIEHINPDAFDVTDRGSAVGYECRKFHGLLVETGLAENIYQTSLYEKGIISGDEADPFFTWYSVEELSLKIVDGWLNSEGHKENLLNSGFTREGIGVAIDENNDVYVTQVFC
jgi:uncharacterized protein YkwD